MAPYLPFGQWIGGTWTIAMIPCRRRVWVYALAAFVAGGAVVLVGWYPLSSLLTTAKVAAADSAAASLAASLLLYSSTNHAQADFRTAERRLLTDHEYDALVTMLANKGYHIDGPKAWSVGKPLLDPWKHRYQIEIGSDAQGTPRCRVRSLGPDGLSDTHDDIVRSF